jgi:hypothetical protein
MTYLLHALARQSRVVLSAWLILVLSSTAALSDGDCGRLDALASQYAGVELNSAQTQFKRIMVTCYLMHGVRHAAR